jgi:mannitol/fructose-specific phosphotransferase system IIA component (Ntr-type)
VSVTISETLDPRCVVLYLNGPRRREVVEELVKSVDALGKIGDADRLIKEILERERLASTALGNGVAVPHKLSEEVSETVLAVGRVPQGAKFDAPDNEPVRLVFLLIGPPNAQTAHLRLLSRLSRYLHDPAFRSRILEASSQEEVVQIFAEREGHQ